MSNTPCLSPTQTPLGKQTFQEIYQENLAPIYRYVYSKVGNREEAEDLTAQVFLKAIRKIDIERGPYSTRKWLFQVARTTVADYWRAHYGVATASLEELMSAGWEGPTEDVPESASDAPAERVQHILKELPQRYREVLTCRFLFSLSVRETARLMGLSEENIKVIQFRALKRAASLTNLED